MPAALIRTQSGGEVRTKGYHGLGALAVEPTEMGAPVVKPLGSAAGPE
ncbi:hypothetical protein D187_001013 [Cystobacter fuscus DSM 2262]|uniref:Uncharacterized protein n=1 Tax=Cystobacter fuscus (strain ATCC 25194 / DSM 2262 / NBRC 100088 / M29) TaxID=1242864 RepID=S9PA10_CYSF2|nr:hypothetical protein D187_001013 [Cystobacter fuscus DSM 2262]